MALPFLHTERAAPICLVYEVAGWFDLTVTLIAGLLESSACYPRTSAPVAFSTLVTSLLWAFSTSSLVRVRSAAR